MERQGKKAESTQKHNCFQTNQIFSQDFIYPLNNLSTVCGISGALVVWDAGVPAFQGAHGLAAGGH